MTKGKNSQSLNIVLGKTIDALEEGKKDVFNIAESSRKEYENIKSELSIIHRDISEIISKSDKMELINKKARLKLMDVSKNFKQYSEDAIQDAYQKAEKSSVEIAILNEKEEQLKKRRQELEIRLTNLKDNVERAESLVSRMGIIQDYLQGQLSDLSDHFSNLQQKQELAIRIIQAQEEERKRVAREIHDGPAQAIANLVFRVELVQSLIDQELNQAKKELKELKKLIGLTMDDVRKIIYDLRPMSLDDLGLIPTLKRYFNKYLTQTGIMVNFKVTGQKRRLPISYEVTVFRLIQEALNNIQKHAQASYCQIDLEYSSQQINILVSDDGIGFNIEDVDGNNFGLISMEERCQLLRGQMSIKSEINKGTTIRVTIPTAKEVYERDESNKGGHS